ncbi:MAG: hypothetical protein Q8P67_10870 [archaeon]|nr:hypothetical protein [archaeon]
MSQADPETDPTRVDIEPYTGKAIATNQALQVNIYNPCQPNLFELSPFGNQYMACDVMFPIGIVRQVSNLNQANVDQITGELYLGLKLKKIIYGSLLGLALGALVLCGFLGWIGLQRLRHLSASHPFMGQEVEVEPADAATHSFTSAFHHSDSQFD